MLEADCIPAGMELFPASNDDRWTLIKRVIDDCDYYLIVIGGRYGSVDPEQQISYTEMEFDYAESQGKPILAFLHGEPGSIPGDKTDLNDELRAKLDVFRKKVGNRMVKYWDSPTGLGGQVAKSLIQIRKTHPAEGWVRAKNALTPEVERELVELRARVVELTTELATTQRDRLPGSVELANGEDAAHVKVLFRYMEDGVTKRIWGQFETTWDRLFSAVGPRLLVEASESDLLSGLNAIARSISEEDGSHEKTLEKFDIKKSEFMQESFQDILVQFTALGLIVRSDRRHPINDSNIYWTLTSEGNAKLVQLRAARKPPETVPEIGAASDEGERQG
ncbi:DUF4062 domain-containing protein [Kribbella sandramycini]